MPLHVTAEKPPFSSVPVQRAAPVKWRPAFRAEWAPACFVHFAVDPRALQPAVPFPLDLHGGEAYVSLVAFTMARLRPGWLDNRVGEWLMRGVAPCRFLNVRTYVRSGGVTGIYFLGEWLSQWVNIPLGPLLYGLPYHPGRLRYDFGEGCEIMSADVRGQGARLAFSAQSEPGVRRVAEPGTLDHFLLERYLAFTIRRGSPVMFEVAHEPWLASPADVTLEEGGLLRKSGAWFAQARLVGGHLTPGVLNVSMSPPRPVRREPRSCRTERSAFCADC